MRSGDVLAVAQARTKNGTNETNEKRDGSEFQNSFPTRRFRRRCADVSTAFRHVSASPLVPQSFSKNAPAQSGDSVPTAHRRHSAAPPRRRALSPFRNHVTFRREGAPNVSVYNLFTI